MGITLAPVLLLILGSLLLTASKMGVRMKLASFMRIIRSPFLSNNQHRVKIAKSSHIQRIRIQNSDLSLHKVPILPKFSMQNFGPKATAGTGASKTGGTIGSMFILMGLIQGLIGMKEPPVMDRKPIAESVDNDELLILLVRASAAQNRNDSVLATKLFEESLKSAETRKLSGKYNENDYLKTISFINDNLANLAFSAEQFPRAETHFKKTKEICMELGYNKSDNAIIQINLKLATIFAMQKRTAEAKAFFRSCVEAPEGKVTDHDQTTNHVTLKLLKTSTEAYARYLFHLGEYTAAEKSFNQSIDISNSVYGPAHPETLSLINVYAMMKMAQGDTKGAEQTLKNAITCGNSNIKEFADIQKTLGDVYLKIGQKHQASEAFQMALKIYRNTDNAPGISAAQNALQEIVRLQDQA